MHLFTAEGYRRVAAGEITVTYRLWSSPHVKAGKTYPTGFGDGYFIEDVRVVRASDIPAADIPRTGSDDLRSLLERAGEHTGTKITPGMPLYRVQLRYAEDEPAKPALSLAEIRSRVARLDGTSPRGPWTLDTLRLIADNPRTVARRLAHDLRWEVADFKLHVRKLKALGLTVSLPIGYELSDLGQAYLDSLRER